MPNFPYDSFDLACKNPFGAVPAAQEVHFSLYLSDFYLPIQCTLLFYKADEFDSPIRYTMGITHEGVGYNRFSCSIAVSQEPGLFFYCFEVDFGTEKRQIRRIDSHNGDFTDQGELWQLTVYDPLYVTPTPVPAGIIYQIFPDRFFRQSLVKQNIPSDRLIHEHWDELPVFRPNEKGEITNSDYFGGDLAGIEQKLPYLKQLGVSLIYLNPIFEAHSNHRYNVADYFKVDPLLGTNEDFAHLCKVAESYQIGIILDGVFSHTGSDSVYFNKNRRYGPGGAYNDPQSPYRCWYKFEDYPTRYHSWWGFDTLPEIIEETPSYLDFICGEHGVIAYWMGMGARGFRLDVADELPDVILERLRQAVKKANPQGLLIGEVWEDASNKIAYSQRRRYLLGHQLDAVMNYPFMDIILRYVRYGDYGALYHGILTILENYPAPSKRYLFNSLSTHDTTRALTVLVGEEYTGGDREWQAGHMGLSPEQYNRGCQMLLIAYTLLYFLPGIPCLYYGDEAGVAGWRDPFNRTTYPWGHADENLIAAFCHLGQLRRAAAFLSDAKFLPVCATADVFIYTRAAHDGSLTVAVNRSGIPQNIQALVKGKHPHVITGSLENGILAPLSAIVCLEN